MSGVDLAAPAWDAGIEVFVGLQGGCGTTQLAIAHAAAVGAVLVDADLEHGDVAERLPGHEAVPLATLAGHPDPAADAPAGIDGLAVPRGWLEQRLPGGVQQPGSGGVDGDSRVRVVSSPSDPCEAELLDSRAVAAAVASLGARERCVVDAGSRIDPTRARIIGHAQRVVLVADGRPAQVRLAGQVVRLIGEIAPAAQVVLATPSLDSARARRLLAARMELAAYAAPDQPPPRVAGQEAVPVWAGWLEAVRVWARRAGGHA